ncbi:MAG: CDP-diacylglycerol--glycerol-3-phosphate 3-phosphatidyltransferase [Bryobacterales bacterium]|nr:CDP-diacylglycerol--glycerol-3-phosphate 3-phosphatidyltransferase [Bryobacterales bacterium]
MFTIPNLFTALRILATPFILWALAHRQFIPGGWLTGIAAFTDLLDGAVARRFGGETKFGQYLDPIADKILLSGVYIGLGLGGAVPMWLLAVIFGRDLWILLLSGIALRFTNYRELEPSNWGKASTFVQVMTAVGVLAGRGYRDDVLLGICGGLFWFITALAITSAGDYTARGVRWFLGPR